MTIHQISIFLENKYGRLNEILALIAQEDIRIVTATIADTSEFGILRIITTDPLKAHQVLKEHNISANLNEVFAIETEPVAGAFVHIVDSFTQAGISIEYMYCFSSKERGVLVLRVNNKEAALNVIRRNNIVCISESKLVSM